MSLNGPVVVDSESLFDELGQIEDVVLGFDDHNDWVEKNVHNHMGVVVGRTSNRISNDSFVLDGVTYELASCKPNHKHHLHGGPKV